jgi:hypothetical protein
LFAAGVVGVVVVVVVVVAGLLMGWAAKADEAVAIGTAIGIVARANAKGTLAVRPCLASRCCFFLLAFFATRRASLVIVRSPPDVFAHRGNAGFGHVLGPSAILLAVPWAAARKAFTAICRPPAEHECPCVSWT